jgi:hypothetical protein
MANTMTLISSVTVGAGGATSIDFTSIPATYTDLILKISARSDAGQFAELIFNGSTTGYSNIRIEGDGSTAYSNSRSDDLIQFLNGSSTTANTFGNAEIYIPNYRGSTNKSFSQDFVAENNATAATASLWAGLWSNTAAITSISLDPQGTAKFVQYSTAYLYGVKNA